MTKEINRILNRNNKKSILYDAYYEKNTIKKPVVVFCHGYKGFKDWGAWHIVAEEFSKTGIFFLKFNFSYNGGTLENAIDFPDLEAFAQNNFTTELDDLDRIIELICQNSSWKNELDITNISLIGHSRGGGIVLIKAEENPFIKNVVTWASVSDFGARFQEGTPDFENWKKTGITFVENSRTKQQMPHYIQFYEDFKKNENRLTIKRAVQTLKIPQLIIHGSADTSVSIKEAENLHKWNPESSFVNIPNGDHVFGSSHPWKKERLPEDLHIVVEKTLQFLN